MAKSDLVAAVTGNGEIVLVALQDRVIAVLVVLFSGCGSQLGRSSVRRLSADVDGADVAVSSAGGSLAVRWLILILVLVGGADHGCANDSAALKVWAYCQLAVARCTQ